jgi:hypothetical protein
VVTKEARTIAEDRGIDLIADYPNPDLAVEVDISPPEIDRSGIDAALNVPEVWHLGADGAISIERLGDDGHYTAAQSSGFCTCAPMR